MSCLVILELENGIPNRPSLATLTAANELSENVDILVLDSTDKETVAKQTGAKNIYYFANNQQNILAEEIVDMLVPLASKYNFLLAPSGTFAKNFMPRLSAMLDKQMISDVIKIHDLNTFDRPIYAGNAIATVQTQESIKLLTIRPTAFEPLTMENGSSEFIQLDSPKKSSYNKFIGREESKSERPELSSASIVISGGRGIGSSDNFKIIESLADKLGAAVGASRAAVDAGFISNDYQVGQTGKVVAPELYIAVGISGAIQHLAGMKDSKIIVAINKDEEAPIFQIADYGLVGDLFTTLPQIMELI
ncbi:FAD-binding protein [Alphaproteobacteria bacterium]|nr:FAD-binding protein [Alphaproteobacteria bacterium]